MGTLKTG